MHACGSLCSHNGKTPLLCAAKAGHDEIVAYLLQFRTVLAGLKSQPEVVKNASVRLWFIISPKSLALTIIDLSVMILSIDIYCYTA